MLDPAEQKLVDDIANHGWHLVCVAAEGSEPAFVYSVGFMETFDHPEIIVFGLAVDPMCQIINVMGNDVRGGRPFRETGLYEDLIDGYACKVVPVANRLHREYLGFALWHRWHTRNRTPLAAVQCLWPDRAGLFRGEDGFHEANIALQPLLI